MDVWMYEYKYGYMDINMDTREVLGMSWIGLNGIGLS
jgi:hypothetical protein